MSTQLTISVLRGQVEAAISDRAATTPATPRQYRLIAASMERVVGTDRELRIKMLRGIYPYGIRPVESTKHLSVLEAGVLIRFLFGLDPYEDMPPEPALTPEAEEFLEVLQHELLWAERAELIRRGQLQLEIVDA